MKFAQFRNKTVPMSIKNLAKLLTNSSRFSFTPVRLLTMRNSRVITPVSNLKRLCHLQNFQKTEFPTSFYCKTGMVLGLSLLTWLGFEEDDEKKESELIVLLKRSVLCMRREQYEKAERMLHLALRVAQQQQNTQGVTYCYDLMANVAMERRELEKAEKLFVAVLQLLLSTGMEQDDLKVIHVSLKLARIAQLGANMDKAELGYTWCLEKIQAHKNDSPDAKMLYGVVQDWYAQFLLDKGQVKKSLLHLQEAYEACRETKGAHDEQTLILLNDLGLTCFRAEEFDRASDYLKEAIKIGQDVAEKEHLGVVHANLGLVLLEKGVAKEAEKNCKEAWRLGKKHDNTEAVELANYCFDQIHTVLGNKK